MKIQKSVLFSILSLCCLTGSLHGQTRILPLGDSVTSSFSPYSSYRYWLWQSLVQSGYNVDFVGSQYGVTGGPPGNQDFDQDHEGHSGWTTSDGVFNIGSIASATVPDIVLLDLGANDVDEGISPTDSTTNLVNIIEVLRSVNPNVVILLAQPTPFLDQDRRAMSLLRGAIKRAAKIEKRAGVDVRVVNLAGSFNPRKDTSDGTHPNQLGEQKIARRYYSVIRKVLGRPQ